MASIVIKDVPKDVHEALRVEAAKNRRSMNQEALTILERALKPLPPLPKAKPVKTLRPFTNAWLLKAMREGRE
jgi:plasmid stability protein